MASLFQTMFVSPSSLPTFPQDPKALPPVWTPVESTSIARNEELHAFPVQKGATVTSGPSWLSKGLFNTSQLQAIFGSRRVEPADNAAQDRSPEPRAPTPVPCDSADSFAESLGAFPMPGSGGTFPQKPCLAKMSYDPGLCVDLMDSYSNSRARGPFKPQRTSKGTSSWQLRQFAEATLGSGSLRKAVKLPEGEDINEWLAVNIVDFYNQINLLYGSITEFCSPQTCPEMKATDEFEYLWQDSENFKRPTKMPAPEYIEHLMAWCQSNIDNEQHFPSRIGVPFPKTFPSLVRQMFKRLYRVYAHIYCHHYPVIQQLGLEPHLNTSFKHYVLFIDEHQLATGKDFWGPLGELVDSMLKSD